jgi:hypothetical protein
LISDADENSRQTNLKSSSDMREGKSMMVVPTGLRGTLYLKAGIMVVQLRVVKGKQIIRKLISMSPFFPLELA